MEGIDPGACQTDARVRNRIDEAKCHVLVGCGPGRTYEVPDLSRGVSFAVERATSL